MTKKISSDWKELIKKDWPKIGPITKETIEQLKKSPKSVRDALGKNPTDEEWEKLKIETLNKPLP